MPTITISKKDLESLLKRDIPPRELEDVIALAKGEVKKINGDELKVDLADTNRPDLLCTEGIAREIKGKFVPIKLIKTDKEIIVKKDIKNIRPYICGVLALNVNVKEEVLTQLIQAQEKLTEVYGHNRKDVAIGIFNADVIKFPIFYHAVKPETRKFVPLDMKEELTMRQIVKKHPKGRGYGHLVKGFKKFPLLEDSNKEVISFPPIINSEKVGKVKPEDSNLFCDITGTNIEQVILVANILAYNFRERGAKVIPIKVKYEFDTPLGKEIILPYDFKETMKIKKQEFEALLGIKVKAQEIKKYLIQAGYRVNVAGSLIKVTPPPYRRDIMHSVDVIEDFAIRKGYNSFEPDELEEFTVGKTTPLQPLIEKARNVMVGCGFEEIMSNVLTSPTNLFDNMDLTPSSSVGQTLRSAIEVENALSESFSVLRTSIIPSLLRVEAASSKALYPHKMFEVGEVVDPDNKAALKSKTSNRLTVLIAHAHANFSELHSFLDMLAFYLGFTYKLKKITHPSFIKGRVVSIALTHGKRQQHIGILGEVHPKVLENWGIKKPVSVFELSISEF